ncbi:glutamyl-Q tRNA(Asp) synthetase [Hoeflea marina]|uniref:Glutamyl-Q tRNA(Asp) synthetase n=1 Tax=Hoeflea marina TaxID=274592 RepID=A0A317PGS2_9HYPH|nr:tRNA glutamyl-Q(34) synthetase GluQRS [Hoeflea marina]PWV98071.1 glutamyl-Q tRNA(Asp) synthetase [Hoeflea marina]
MRDSLPPHRTIVRFAPSPNGLLHLGHARSALENWRTAEREHGTFLLRIEDIDADRCRPHYETAIFEDLSWLGLDWPLPVRRQSEHLDAYREALAELQALDLVYPAFLSRADSARAIASAEADGAAWPRDPDGAPHYPGAERAMAASQRRRRVEAGEPFAWRLDMRAACAGAAGRLQWLEADGAAGRMVEADPASWGDVVLARRDTPTSYHLSVTVDDHVQAITDVIRGRDLYHATSVHRLLQTLLGFPAPRYRHHGLVTDASGRKLSKSDGDTAIASMRAAGMSPASVARLAFAGEAPGDDQTF